MSGKAHAGMRDGVRTGIRIGATILLAGAILAGEARAVQDVPAMQPQAQPGETRPEADRQRRFAELVRLSLDAFRAGEFGRAEAYLRQQLEIQPDNFVIHYNLAAARDRQGDAAGAMQHLRRAIETGFTDIHQLRRDPSLAGVRVLPEYARLEEAWPQILDARRDASVASLEALFQGPRYVTVRDDRLRLVYRSAFDARAFDEAREELTRIAAWGEANVFGDILDPGAMLLDAWVVVVLPTREDFTRWAISVYGADAVRGTSAIGGIYEHDFKRLVAMDLGSTLRHEFFHVLHWRSITRLGQPHPIWIMEGLCSLVEDMDTQADGSLVPAPSWRTNITKRMEQRRLLMPISTLATLSHARFTGGRPLANYAHARSVFLWLWSRGKLRSWYQTYTTSSEHGFRADPTGLKAMQAELGMTIEEIDQAFRSWLRALPSVPEEIRPGMASLGVEIEAGDGEGPVVVSVPRRGGQAPELRVGDIITSINGRATRDMAELVRVLGSLKPGERTTVSVRRFRRVLEVEVELIEKK